MRFVLSAPIEREEFEIALHSLTEFLLKHRISKLADLVVSVTALRDGIPLEAVDDRNEPKAILLDQPENAERHPNAIPADDVVIQERRAPSFRRGLAALLGPPD